MKPIALAWGSEKGIVTTSVQVFEEDGHDPLMSVWVRFPGCDPDDNDLWYSYTMPTEPGKINRTKNWFHRLLGTYQDVSSWWSEVEEAIKALSCDSLESKRVW